MVLRSRLRDRFVAALRAVVPRALSTEETWGRTPSWPPNLIGEEGRRPEPALHPLDRVMAGLPTVAPPARAAEASTPPVDDADADEADFPWGGVAQERYLPPPPSDIAVRTDLANPPAPTRGAVEAAPAAVETSPAAPGEQQRMKDEIVQVLQTIFDPEIPVDIYALGLIYDVEVLESRDVEIRMTLTSPNCPAAQSLPGEVEQKSASVPGVRSAMVDVVWDPPWGPERMSEEARLELNIDG
jgi:FeS assembly SUF system protein